MAKEISITDEFIYSLLSGDAALVAELDTPPASIGGASVYFDAIPQEVQLTNKPVIIVRHKPPREDDDFITFNGVRIWTDVRVRIVATALVRDYAALTPAANQIDELLHLAKRDVTGGWIHKAQRLAPYVRTYFEGNLEHRELGADWLLQASATVGF